MRWVFTADNAAVQVCHITQLKIGKTGVSSAPWCVLAHVIGQTSPILIKQFESGEEAADYIKDTVVGRNDYRRS